MGCGLTIGQPPRPLHHSHRLHAIGPSCGPLDVMPNDDGRHRQPSPSQCWHLVARMLVCSLTGFSSTLASSMPVEGRRVATLPVPDFPPWDRPLLEKAAQTGPLLVADV